MPDAPTHISETSPAIAPTVRAIIPHPTRTDRIRQGAAVIASLGLFPGILQVIAGPALLAVVAAWIGVVVLGARLALRRFAMLRVELTPTEEGLWVAARGGDPDATQLKPWIVVFAPTEDAEAVRMEWLGLDGPASIPRTGDRRRVDAFVAAVRARMDADTEDREDFARHQARSRRLRREMIVHVFLSVGFPASVAVALVNGWITQEIVRMGMVALLLALLAWTLVPIRARRPTAASELPILPPSDGSARP